MNEQYGFWFTNIMIIRYLFIFSLKCESTCGSGKRHRSVLCIKELPGNVRVIVGEENCEGVAKPTETEPCEAAASCTPEWYMASWSEVTK